MQTATRKENKSLDKRYGRPMSARDVLKDMGLDNLMTNPSKTKPTNR